MWLKHLTHGLNYTLDVVDHSGKNVEMEMRGTSSKADWANVCLQVLPEKRQGGLMRIKVKYAKARGLRPDQTDDFVCQYDFAGNWTLGASDKEQEDTALKEELKKLLPKKLIQEKMAKKLKISAGKVNKLLKEIEKKQLYDLLESKHVFDIPEGIFDEEFKIIWQRVEKAKQDNKLDEDDKNLLKKQKTK